MKKRTSWSLLPLAVVAAMFLAACAGGTTPTEDAAEPEAEEAEDAAEEEAEAEAATEEEAEAEEEVMEEVMEMPVVALSDSADLGQFMVDGEGMTLYLFTVDDPNVSNCSGGCLERWPAFISADGSTPDGMDLTGAFGITTRDDDSEQVTYNGMPIYYFAGDAAVGDTNGQGLGNVWFVISPDPVVAVRDQPIANSTVSIERVIADQDGWLVIHTEADGNPGPVIGQAAVATGLNKSVVVEIDADMATETLFAMLHVDAGTAGEYEFPGDDGPVADGEGNVITPPFSTNVEPSVVVRDQEIEDGTVTIAEVVALVDGWLVVHADNGEGGPGPVIGFAPVSVGINQRVTVEIDEAGATDTMFAMLHVDAGVAGEYEFPGDDGPVSDSEENVVTPPFSLSS